MCSVSEGYNATEASNGDDFVFNKPNVLVLVREFSCADGKLREIVGGGRLRICGDERKKVEMVN